LRQLAKIHARRSSAVLALYGLLAIVFTYPLLFNMSTGAPAGEAWTYDGFSMLWNLWWFKHALLDLNANPFDANSIFAPLGESLYLHSYTVFSDVVALPLLAWLSPLTTSNLILIGSLALSGFGMHLLAKYLVGSDAVALAASVVYMLSTSRFVFLAMGHYNFFTTEWLPFYLLYLLKALRRPTRHAIFMAAFFLVLALLVELSLGVMLVLLTCLYWGLQRFVSSPVAAGRSRFTITFTMLAIFGLAALLSSPYLLPTARESFDPKYIPQYWGGAPVLSADVVGLFTPSSLSTFLGSHDWPREWLEALQDRGRFAGVNTFFLGYGMVALALLGAAVERRARIWLWLALALVVLSLGPLLHINGRSVFDLDGMQITAGLPYILLHYIPLLNGLRAPERFSIPATMVLAILVAYATAWATRAAARRGRPVTAAVLVLTIAAAVFEHLALPVPIASATVPAVYERIAREPGDFTLLDIPLGWRSGFGPLGTENTQFQYYQTAHGKRLISGFAARTPSFIFDYFQRQPILSAIAQLESEGKLPPGAPHDRALAAELAYFFDLRYILVHPPAAAPTPYDATMQRVGDYVRELFDIDQVAGSDGITVYRVNQPAPRPGLLVDFGTDTSNLNRAEGWGGNESIGGTTANWLIDTEGRAFVPLRLPGPYRLMLRTMPFAYPAHPSQTLTLRVNGRQVIPSIALTDSWSEYSFDLAASDTHPGLNEIAFAASTSASPANVLPGSADARRLSLAVDWLKLETR
jgi:hypothetical protein